jgi:hypothetical protein
LNVWVLTYFSSTSHILIHRTWTLSAP